MAVDGEAPAPLRLLVGRQVDDVRKVHSSPESLSVGRSRPNAERFDGTPFTDRGFARVPVLANFADLLDAILVA
jgi:hypothetical protein